MLKIKSIHNEEIYISTHHIVFLRKGMYDGTKVTIEGMTVINSVDPLEVVLSDLERLNYD